MWWQFFKLELAACQHFMVKTFRCPHILVVKLVTNDHATYAYSITNFSRKIINDHATLTRWNVGVNHISMQMSFQLSLTSFVIKNLCKFSRKLQHCNNSMWHLWLKNNYLQLKKLVVNMQIPCIEVTPGTIIFFKLDFFKTYD